jgi:thiamine phosphate synthase YjbQ (UPF0047 family)
MEAVRTSETSVDNQFTRQYNPEDSSEHHTRRRENLKSHMWFRYLSNTQVILVCEGQVLFPADLLGNCAEYFSELETVGIIMLA